MSSAVSGLALGLTGGAAGELAGAAPMHEAQLSEPRKKHGSRGTFAPPSAFKNIRDYVKPTKGAVVEIIVAWRERVIDSRHFSGARVITMGSHPECDIPIPNF